MTETTDLGRIVARAEHPRVAVLGAGANGAAIGADLTNAGVDVTLIEQWPAHVEAMRRSGIRIEMPGRTQVTDVRVSHLCEVATFRELFDVVLLLVKAYDTRWACELIKPYLRPDGLVAGVQNGMTTDVIADVVGPDRTMGCVIEISSMMFEPGIVQRDSPFERSWFAVGGISQATVGRVQDVARLLQHAGSVDRVHDIRATKWMKLVSNATTLVTTAILGLPIVEAVELAGMREFMVRSGREALTAGAAQGFPPLPIFGLNSTDLVEPERVVDLLLDTLLAGFVLRGTKTTVLQDWVKHRHSEVDDLNGLVVAESERYGLAAPVNRAVVDFAHRIERGELDPGRENLIPLLDAAGV